MRLKKVLKMKDIKFKRTVGIPKILFELIVEVIEHALIEKHKRGVRNPNLNAGEILLMTLIYYRDYPTFLSLGNQFGIDESNAFRWFKWCQAKLENIFLEMIRIEELDENQEQLVDVTECTIQRPKNNEIQKEYYSGKKKKHTIKVQIIMNEKDKKIAMS